MMEVINPDQFDLDRLAEELGKLPEAPLAMPAQDLEQTRQDMGWIASLRPHFARIWKAGH